MLKKLLHNPKNIFLIDGIGALVSAILLGCILVYFETYFGIPKNTLYLLALFPSLFAIYDLICFNFIQNNLGKHLKFIAILNTLYILLSILMAFLHHESITWFGYTYIIVEIIILITLIQLEWQIIKTL